ncbi:MAG: DNA polymerase III subunit gamma/tau [Ignavibacteriae bacterium]|nr:DNA polymerase III subunit gamma/tau [Ignavibacteriota bacterium]
MSFIVTARKWRPMVFGDVVGQSHVTTTLRNAIATNRLHHAFVFSGPRGVGKTTTARILAKAINCLHPNNIDPDNSCEFCTEITEGRSVHVFEIDGASNRGIEEIRSLREAVRYGPAKGKYKVYIIDEVHMLTKEAFNALLKTLEEPPSYVIFVFATTEIHKVPLTILSRCQRFDFRRVTVEEICSRLRFIAEKENIVIDDEALFLLAHKADGSMRDAQSLFDQVVSFCGTNIDAQQIMQALNIVDQELYFRVTSLIKSKEPQGMLSLVEEIMSKGYDFREFVNGFIEHLRNLLIARSTGSVKFIEASDAFKKRYQQESSSFTETDLLRLIKIGTDTEAAIKWSQQPRYKLEIALLQMQKMDSSILIDQLLQQLESIKQKMNGGFSKQASGESDLFGGATTGKPALKSPLKKMDDETNLPSQPLRATSEPTRTYVATSKNITTPQQTVTQSFEQRVTPISMDEAFSKWQMFVNGAKKEKIHVGTMLSESKLKDVKENRLQISCPDDFHLETFNRHKQFLFTLAEQVYGAKVRLEAIVSQVEPLQHSAGTNSEQAEPTNAAPPTAYNDLLNHPITQLIIKEFGCEVVE